MDRDLIERDAAVCWHPYTQHALDTEPLPVVAASGAWLELADGTRRLDAISSWWAILHGHGRPELVEAMRAQAARLDHVLFAGVTHPTAVALAEALVEIAPEGLGRVFYSDDGSTAVEVALKAAAQAALRRGQRRRRLFLALEGGYHGDTFGAMSVGDPDPFFLDFEPYLFEVLRVPPTVEALREAFERHGDALVALVLEPMVQGAAGMRFLPAELLVEARRLCDESGAYLVADEVMTGFGRTGRLFACEHAGITPDLLCLAKGLTGGVFPLSATLVKASIFDAFLADERSRAFFHGHTFTGHPVGAAVALASLEIVRREGTPERLAEIGARIEAGLSPLVGRPGVREVRRLGGIVAAELEVESGGYLAAVGERLRSACRARDDVLLRPLGPVLYALPPSCTSAEEAGLIARAMVEVVEAALGR